MIVVLVVVVILVTAYILFPLIQVCGDSMYPTYLDGEIIIGTRLFRKSKLKVGDVIVYTSPRDKDRVVIKRISKIMQAKECPYFYCLGDNADHSYDSRHYGYISSKSIKCKIVKQRGKENHDRSEDNVCG